MKTCILILAVAALPARAQRPGADSSAPAPKQWTAAEDHQQMMRQLGITALRSGPSGNERDPNHANYDEAMANPFPKLPDVLTLQNGERVTTPALWAKRRAEIVELFDREVYGRVPTHVPKVTWTVAATDTGTIGGRPVIGKRLVGHVDNSAYPLITVDIQATLVVPADAKGPVPAMIMFRPGSLAQALGRPTPPPANRPAFTFPPPPPGSDAPAAEQLILDGWGFVFLNPTDVQADNGAGLTNGIIGLVNKGQPRKPDDWGALRAWAWGASRTLDDLENEHSVNAKKVAIEGVSRYGKAALVTMAFDQRFAAVLIGSSGEGGAKLHRRNWGEAVESLTGTGEYHWMAGNFLKYGASEATFGSKNAGDIPVDAHELLALCAPRLTFVSYGIPEKGDAKWLDHQGSYMAAVAAQPVFRLLGAKGLGVSDDYMKEKMPPVNVGLLDGQLAWRQHDGGHTDAPNVKYFLSWADFFFKRRYTPAPAIPTPAAPPISNAAPTQRGTHWLGTWQGPPQLTEPRNLPPAPGLSGKTLRQVIHVSIGGTRWRLRFSNEFGNGPVTIGAARAARAAGEDGIDASHSAILSFNGKPRVVIPAGGTVYTDPFDLDAASLSEIAVTTYVDSVPSDLTGHPGSRTTSFIADGDVVAAERLPGAVTTEHWYLLDAAEVIAAENTASVVVLGNSIADGRGSGTNKNDRWPDNFARRLLGNAGTSSVAMVNAGIGGNTILRGGLGPTALMRLERDVLMQAGARWTIVSEGVNDIGGARGADSSASIARQLIAAYKTIISRARARGMRVYGATILPFGGSQYGNPDHEAARQTVNTWIKTGGAFDAVIDLDAVMRDPSDATRLRSDADSGDHLHPNELGYRVMADAIDLKLFMSNR